MMTRVRVSRFSTGLAMLALFLFAGLLGAQPRKRPPAYFVQPRPPDQEEGRRILEASREIGLAGPYYFEFELLIRPKNGEESVLTGRWFGSRNASGPIARLEIVRPEGGFETWLVQSGPNPAVWIAENAASGELVTGEALFRNRLGTTIAPVDLQLPFMYWQEHVYEGFTRFRGRPTYVFLLYPDEATLARGFAYAGARVFIDKSFSAISQVQWVSEDGKPLKTISVSELKKVGDEWIVKAFEVRDETTRDKTRLVVRRVALNQDLPSRLFSPAESFEPAAIPVDTDQLVSLE